MKRGKKGVMGWLKISAILVILLLFWTGPALAATIEGNVDDLTGNYSGIAFIKVMWDGGGESGFGTAIDLEADDYFSIDGLQDGTYVVTAFVDESYEYAIPYGWSARGQSQVITITDGSPDDTATVEVDYPTSTPTPALNGIDVIPGDGIVGIFIKPQPDSDGFYNADAITVCYDTDPGFATEYCPPEFEELPVTGEETFLALNDLDNDIPIYIRATPYLDGDTGDDATTDATPTAPPGGHSVSGTLTFTNFLPEVDTNIYVALVNDRIPGVTEPTIVFTHMLADGASSMPFTIQGAADSYYYIYTLVDDNNDGVLNYMEPATTDSNAPLVQVSGQDLTGVAVEITDDPLTIGINSEHEYRQNQDYYSLNIQFRDGIMRPAAVSLEYDSYTDGALGRMDIGRSQYGEFWVNLYNLGYRPSPDDYFEFYVIYTDGSDDYIEVSADAILDAFATPISPLGYILNELRPDFSWSAPVSDAPEPFFGYEVRIWNENGGYTQLYPPEGSNSEDYYLPSDTTFLAYPLGSDLDMDQSYQWQLSVVDRYGNKASVTTDFTPVTELPATPITHIGIFRSGKWYLDVDDSQTWDPLQDILMTFGKAGDIPVVGDWDGTGTMRVGVFRSGKWYLDMNNDHVFDPLSDATFTFGKPGDIPVVGNWDGTGTTRVGVFRNGKWYLDMNNDHVFGLSDTTFSFGKTGDVPVVGDWDGTGTMKVGVFRNNKWYLDMNNDHVFDLFDTTFSFGITGDIPVVGDWDGTGTMRVGVFRNGKWFLDLDNDHAFDPLSDAFFTFGKTGDIPLTINH